MSDYKNAGDLLLAIENPGSEYRPTPFWSWNDRLEPEELRRQIREMKKAGLGGYFMHARGGLETPYLSEEWMACIAAGIDEGEKQGLGAWCYDEEGWPSGFAGGRVTALGDRYHVRKLNLVPMSEDGSFAFAGGQALGFYAVSGKAYRHLGADGEAAIKAGAEGEKIYAVTHTKNPYYVDILNKEVVAEFIRVTYDEYYRRFPEKFGKGMPGFFTDEPQFARDSVPWSYVIPESFEKRFKYDPRGHLIGLFLELDGCAAFRHDFWALVSELYVASFGKQIFDWCEAHHCKFTGHVMMEDNMYCQLRSTGGAMPFYAYMHNPGMDWLCRRISSPVIPKQVGSVAAQLGKKHVLSETFALCGWDVSFEELRWIALWQCVNGVNLLCQHLEGYTLRGLRKRDYPPSMFLQQPWWDEYRAFNDYFSRLGLLLSEGKETVDALLLHPLHSGRTVYAAESPEELKKLDREFENATSLLSGLHITHHYGDETILASHGSVKDGRLFVGNMAYGAVYLPSLTTLDKTTLSLLTEFIDAGGRVVSLGSLPSMVDGRASDEIKSFNARVTRLGQDRELVRTDAVKNGVSSVSVSSTDGEAERIHLTVREFEGFRLMLLVNLDREKSFHTRVSAFPDLPAAELALETPALSPLPRTGTDRSIRLDFAPMQARLLVFAKEFNAFTEKKPEARTILPLSREWRCAKRDANCFTLDTCAYALDGGDWQAEVPVSHLMEVLLSGQKNRALRLKFSFDLRCAPESVSDMRLAAEYSDRQTIFVNGNKLVYDGSSWWKDRSFKTFDIRNFLRRGANEIIVDTEFYQKQHVYDVLFGENVLETERNRLTLDTELESLYLIGDFGAFSETGFIPGDRRALFTDGPFFLDVLPELFDGGDLVRQGLPFFAGKITLEQTVAKPQTDGRVIFEIPRPFAVLSRLYVNGKPVKTMLWADYSADITDHLADGENTVSVELISGNRNLLWPHHHPDGECYAVSPGSFAPHGELDNPRRWRKRYCLVRFGLDD